MGGGLEICNTMQIKLNYRSNSPLTRLFNGELIGGGGGNPQYLEIAELLASVVLFHKTHLERDSITLLALAKFHSTVQLPPLHKIQKYSICLLFFVF